MMEKIIKIIPAKINEDNLHLNKTKKKVCGYARVSTKHDEQITSYKSQVEYYTKYINDNPSWEFVGIYTDEGISATSTKKRDGFNEMINDAMLGKIDLIITKSISRFARNTVDSLSTIRKLKNAGVEVFFEKENIFTFDTKGELMISLLSSLAQDESRSISENSSWGIRKNFEKGHIRIKQHNFMGYKMGENNTLKIIKKDVKVVRLIYQLYLKGYGYRSIARELMNRNIKSPAGLDTWRGPTVKSILTNEKYKGDVLLQKYYTADYLNKKLKKNTGQVPQYYIENNHKGIVSKEMFDKVQEEIKRREKNIIL